MPTTSFCNEAGVLYVVDGRLGPINSARVEPSTMATGSNLSRRAAVGRPGPVEQARRRLEVRNSRYPATCSARTGTPRSSRYRCCRCSCHPTHIGEGGQSRHPTSLRPAPVAQPVVVGQPVVPVLLVVVVRPAALVLCLLRPVRPVAPPAPVPLVVAVRLVAVPPAVPAVGQLVAGPTVVPVSLAVVVPLALLVPPVVVVLEAGRSTMRGLTEYPFSVGEAASDPVRSPTPSPAGAEFPVCAVCRSVEYEPDNGQCCDNEDIEAVLAQFLRLLKVAEARRASRDGLGMRAPSWKHSSRKLVPGRAGGPGRTSRSVRGADENPDVVSVRRLRNSTLGMGKKGSWVVDHAHMGR